MTDKQLLEQILKKIERIERLLHNKPAPKKTWVKVGIVQQLTGWDSRFLRKARENGLIKFRQHDGRIFEYLLESIDEKWIKR